MRLPLYTESESCRMRREGEGGLSCTSCRSSVHKRMSLLKAYRLPNDDINFDCPHGVPWEGDRPEPMPAKPTRRWPKFPGPGDVAREIIRKWYGQRKVSGCRCTQVQLWMNEKGWLWCLTHKQKVVDEIVRSARELGVDITDEEKRSFWRMHRKMRREARGALKE